MSAKIDSVLLIGGAGFLGHHLIQQFYDRCPGIKIHVFDIRPLSDKKASYFTFPSNEIKLFVGDLTSPEDISKAILESKCDVIVHSASPIPDVGTPELFEKVNVQGTKNIIDVSKKLRVKALIFTSSAGVVFNGADIYNVDEEWPYAEVHMDKYNETKAIAERLVKDSNDPNGLITVSIRPSGIFGPGDRQLVPGLINAAKLGQSKFQLGDNNNICDYTYAGNVADAHILAAKLALQPKEAHKVGGEVFIITNDTPIYFWTMAREVWKAYGVIEKRHIVFNKPLGVVLGYLSETFARLAGKPPGLTAFRVKIACANRYYDISKAKSVLEYKPAVDLETGIKLTLDWLKEVDM
ncbi:sterol-4-alpha-carboxylate 3-dehydrogenase, decarboxylating [Suhomyces tanzawaensis NRRL Y-17324]|uniref:Sterol-4-alpha-carboxylate 3-dehydrogenase, decarboxylating n=1 Tax=Suhomyces tanzawaensis NRRL Y-17324 TaxID=984487 RepID=A0A1E4SB18_9ASCO|nr:sterol-4-alpha-carboxylate 3-dehydrogenase, decarboxylating [Suhomyces tanzawaensis NRRL Y-17324]ODV76668.1 sterol-4-alpha-carboxylate 3-dehydrogenase, decarboxylating [Suhomyces tanzawaensis NRRL Y-17324]